MFARHLLVLKSEVRRQKSAPVFCLLSSVFCLLVPLTAESAPPARIEVVARIYNTAQVTAAITDAALSIASGSMAAGRIDTVWKNCDSSDVCGTAPAARELVIRLVRSRAATAGGVPFVLGEASIDVNERAGVLATIYVDRVERMAELSAANAALLLGRAIAHELGHLLLATNAHSATGLMRAYWSPRDIRGNQIADWVLSREDVAAIRRRFQ